MLAVTQSHVGLAKDAESDQSKKRIILIVAPPHVVSECMIYAVEREFPACAVERIWQQSVPQHIQREAVCLVLLDAALFPQLRQLRSKLFNLNGPVALLQNDAASAYSPKALFAERVRGVLPMQLKLDVWLAALRLLLVGGEYYPLSLFKSDRLRTESEPQHTECLIVANQDNEQMSGLTEREFQVLALVANGLQNKAIAASLGLSEFTVKIHLHNVNTKLGTHNRTQAAALFHAQRKASPSFGRVLAQPSYLALPLS
jgi:DNA-binding NarL/FixJ family response regulator